MKRKRKQQTAAPEYQEQFLTPADASPESPFPYQVGDEINLTIQDVAFGGEGVARKDGFVIFVPFVITGEEIVAKLTEIKKRYARAQLLQVVQPSPHRTAPRCPVFGECGGCQYQHIDYAHQIQIKHKQASDLFARIGGFKAALIDPLVPCPSPYHYRNRVMVRCQWNRERQEMNVGFLRHDNRLVVDVKECHIAEPDLNEDLQMVRENPPRKNGVKVVLRKFPEDWSLPNDSFFQNNFHLLPGLVEAVAGCLQSAGTRHLVDAYCGVGFFSLELSSQVDAFVGVEIDRMAIKAAQENAAARNVSNGEFIEGATEDILAELLQRWPADKTGLILDPPRRGCAAEGLDAIRVARPAQVIYVSCHPATLARDLKHLCQEGGYRLERIIPLDMFPQTQHMECVADLRLEEGTE